MAMLRTALPRSFRVLLSLMLVFTAVFASITLEAGHPGCCGTKDCGVIDGNYDECDLGGGGGECHPNFPKCCDLGGWCG